MVLYKMNFTCKNEFFAVITEQIMNVNSFGSSMKTITVVSF